MADRPHRPGDRCAAATSSSVRSASLTSASTRRSRAAAARTAATATAAAASGGGPGRGTGGGGGGPSRGSVGADTTSSGHSDDRADTVRSGFYLAPAPMKPRRWTKGDCLGSGSFGTVYLGLNGETGELFAVKEVAMTKRTGEGGEARHEEGGIDASAAEAVEQLEQEVELLSRLQHPNIVRYVGISRESRALYIFLEYVPGGSIASLLSRFGAFEESVISVYTRQILIGLDYLHSQRCVHRDIKGGNILVEKSGRIKLADFGMAKSLVEQMADGGSFKGSAYWMAPEVIRQKGSGNHPAADVWSVGCTVIEMASGEHPWGDCSGQVQAIFKIASTKELPRVPEQLSPAASEFVLMCLQRDPDARPDSETLLLHPFVVNAQVDVEVPALRYEGYWSDEFDEDDSRFGGFDGGSEHGAPTSGPASSIGPSSTAHSRGGEFSRVAPPTTARATAGIATRDATTTTTTSATTQPAAAGTGLGFRRTRAPRRRSLLPGRGRRGERAVRGGTRAAGLGRRCRTSRRAARRRRRRRGWATGGRRWRRCGGRVRRGRGGGRGNGGRRRRRRRRRRQRGDGGGSRVRGERAVDASAGFARPAAAARDGRAEAVDARDAQADEGVGRRGIQPSIGSNVNQCSSARN